MSETVYAFSDNRKWRVSHMVARVRRIWAAVALAPRVRRNQWETALSEAVDALATVAATSDDQWSRDFAQRALADLSVTVERWAP